VLTIPKQPKTAPQLSNLGRGIRRDKTRPSRVSPLPRETRLKVIAGTVQETPPNAPPLEPLDHGRGGGDFAVERGAVRRIDLPPHGRKQG